MMVAAWRHARRVGVGVHFDVYLGMVHVFQFMYLIEPKSRQALHAAARFVWKHWGDENAAKSATKAFVERTGRAGR
jgi:acetyl esterase/lipase